MNTPTIKRLDEDVINKIAAGEIIQRPANAVKELLENSLDAGSTQIMICVKEGGLGLIQIQDNGCGIRKEDFEILCERFTTSKLKDFEDLLSIATFGFRGEALASITHVSHVEVISKTEDSICAYKGEFRDGKLLKSPKPCAGNQGTIIKAENLFYNIPVRRESLCSTRDEYNKIWNVISSYALVYSNKCAFTLKKIDNTVSSNPDIRINSETSVKDCVADLYDRDLSDKLILINHQDKILNYSIDGCVSKTNYQGRKFHCITFINNRLVNCPLLKKNMENLYSNIGNKKVLPFIFLHLKVPLKNIDVNVHPTKFEVNFLHQELIIKSITEKIDSQIIKQNESNNFLVKTISQTKSSNFSSPNVLSTSFKSTSSGLNKSFSSPSHQVRVDPKLQKLDTFLNNSWNSQLNKSVNSSTHSTPKCLTTDLNSSIIKDYKIGNVNTLDRELKSMTSTEPTSMPNESITSKTIETKAIESKNEVFVPLPSVNKLDEINQIEELKPEETEVLNNTLQVLIDSIPNDNLCDFSQIVYVGTIDTKYLLVQMSTELWMLNMQTINRVMFHQLIVDQLSRGQGNQFGNIRLDNSNSQVILCDVLAYELNLPPDHPTIDNILQTLFRDRHFLAKYFNIVISQDGNSLNTLPLILDRFIPDLSNLPGFVMALYNQLAKSSDISERFLNIVDELTRYYAGGFGSINNLTASPQELEVTCRDIIIPQYRSGLRLARSYENNTKQDLVRLTSLPELYKVFERC